eukprot:4397335-Amphidinium_carterae.1
MLSRRGKPGKSADLFFAFAVLAGVVGALFVIAPCSSAWPVLPSHMAAALSLADFTFVPYATDLVRKSLRNEQENEQ